MMLALSVPSLGNNGKDDGGGSLQSIKSHNQPKAGVILQPGTTGLSHGQLTDPQSSASKEG